MSWTRAVAGAIALLVVAGKPGAGLAAACAGNTPPFAADSDGDGLPDACDPCPLSTDVVSNPSRDPYCYLGGQTIPPPYQAAEGQAAGSWWTSGDCAPAMAFPVVDEVSTTETARGLVVIGTRTADAQTVLSAARAGQPWPQGVAATCMLSFDYARPELPISPITLRAPVLATLYATWFGPSDDRYTPVGGLGLVADWPIEDVTTRSYFRAVSPTPLQRLAFSRAVVYAGNLLAASSTTCTTGTVPAMSAPWYDPTAASFDTTPVATCTSLVPGATSPEPTDWRVVPTSLDNTLRQHRDLLRRVFAGTALAADPMVDAVEGLPYGLRLDDRAQPSAVQLLDTGALLYGPTGGRGWTVVPEAVATLRQNLHYVPDGLDYVVTAYPPHGDASYSAAGSSPAGALVVQSFDLDPETQAGIFDTAVRGVETQWPGWPSPAATSESSVLYGNRWTSNGGPRECWTSTVDDSDVTRVRPNQQLAYPISVPTDNSIAVAFCPSTLASWRSGTGAARSQLAANAQCGNAATIQDQLIGDLGNNALGCVENVASSAASNLGCCINSYLCPWVPFDDCEGDENSCCDAASESLMSKLGTEGLPCVADAYMMRLDGFAPDDEWEAIPKGAAVPMVALLRAQGVEPSIDSHLSSEDMFVGGRHQGMDWNWQAEDPGSIDPAYRMIGVRDGVFMGIENELEFLVPMGQWKVGWNSAEFTTAYNLHGKKDVLDFLTGVALDHGIEQLGQILGTDPPFQALFGFAGNSWPVQTLVFPGYWRQHYGRGMFAPLATATTSLVSDSHLMAVDKDWPLQTTDPRGKGITPLGLEDWNLVPHRLSFLGDPILDCGHSPYKVEIHPPHVMTMDMSHVSYAGAADGLVVAAFGWMNAAQTERTLEFDLWPPPRPSANARLMTAGSTVQLPEGSVAGAFGPSTWGWAFDRNMDCAEGTPTMECHEVPVGLPNHVHCTYTDPWTGSKPGCDPNAPFSPTIAGDTTTPYTNPRMTPSYATSRFDLRIFMGWK